MSARLRIADLLPDLRAAALFLNNRGNAVYGFNTRWMFESPRFALPGRRWSRRARQAAAPQSPSDLPEGLITWLRQAAQDVQPFISALEQAIPDPEQRGRLRFRIGYWNGRIVITASIALADWRLALDDNGWHITPPRRGGEPFTLPATALGAAWLLLAEDQETRDDLDAPPWMTSLDRRLDIVLAFIDRVLPQERFAIVGTSVGGYLARGVVYHRRALIDGVLLRVPVVIPEPAAHAIADPAVMAALTPEEAAKLGRLLVLSPEFIAQLRSIDV